MLIVNDKGNKILDCQSIFISERPDKDDRSSVFCYDVKGQLAGGRLERIISFETYQEAHSFMALLYRDYGASMRALEIENR